MAKSKHDKVAERIAKRQRTTYNPGPGVDVKGSRAVVEVETDNTVGDAARQLKGYKKPVYVAGTDAKTVKKALEHYKDTTIGVMNPSGKIVKNSTRGRARTKGTGARRS